MTKAGDSFYANEMLDNVLVSDDGFLHAAALLYANGHDLKDRPPLFSITSFNPPFLSSAQRPPDKPSGAVGGCRVRRSKQAAVSAACHQ
jgi:hypothetical protein